MNAITRRVSQLENQSGGARLRPFRLVVSKCWRPLNLAASTCTRTLYPDGHLMEIVHLDGSGDGLSDEDLERFIAKFPIENAHRLNR